MTPTKGQTPMSTTIPRSADLASGLAKRADGTLGIVDTLGNQMADDVKIVVTAGQLAQHLANYVEAGRQAGSESTAALVQVAVDAAAQATAQAAFDAGTKYAAAEIMAKSRVRRKVERDANGQITGIVDVREPIPSTGEAGEANRIPAAKIHEGDPRMTTTTLPSVREQVRGWTDRRSEKGAATPQRETLDARKLKILGSVARSTFATTPDARELRLRGPVRPHRIEEADASVILVTTQVRGADGNVRTDAFLGSVVEPGTFARLAKRKTYSGPKERRPGPLDGLAELRRPADRKPVHLGPDDGSPQGIIMGALSKRPMLLWTDSRSTPMTVRRLIEVANAEGANLRYHNGHALADWNKVNRSRPLLIALWPLVEPTLAGTPLPCAYEHDKKAPPADTLDPAGVPVCNACVGWEPDAA